MPMLALFAAASGQQTGKYIEDFFSPYLYTGTGATQTITNNINLSTNGGLVWIKSRSAATNNNLFDTARGVTKSLHSNTTDSTVTDANSLTAFNTTGFTLGSGNTAGNEVNTSAATYVSWTFQEQPKFFDIVTYTGTGANRTITHNLESVPGCIIVKRTDTTADWAVYHRSLANTQYLVLNSTAAAATGATWWNSTTPTSSVFSLGTDASVNASGGTYVAYIFAHDAGGFGLTGSDNVISCGSMTNGTTVNLGYEPQFVLLKQSDGISAWFNIDNMRGFSTGSTAGTGSYQYLNPNSSSAELPGTNAYLTSTGFYYGGLSGNLIYIAIRRGPMEVPTVGTSVFSPVTYTGTGSTQSITNSNFPPDLVMGLNRTSGISISSVTPAFVDRLRGVSATTPQIFSSNTTQETNTTEISALTMTGFSVGAVASGNWNYSGSTYVAEMFRRAPSFFDEVCYTGTGSATTVTHNLTVVPELIIVRRRDGGGGQWMVYNAAGGNTNRLNLNTTGAYNADISYWNNTSPTSSVFTVGSGADVNASGLTFVAYLFATCFGVSKVGSYTGTAATLQIDCGFTAGSRFVLIKRTDSTGDWYVWDSARGIIAGNDPYLLLNSSAAEVTSTDYVDTYNAGFELTSTAPAAINASGGTFIFLAIA